MSPGRKYTLATVVFYFALGLLIFILGRVSPGGPCVPGMGALLLIFIPLISGTLFLFFFVGRVIGRKAFFGPMLINGGIVVVSLVIFNWH